MGVGGWWVVNKANGEFKYVDAGGVDADAVIEDIEETVTYINEDKPVALRPSLSRTTVSLQVTSS